MPDFRPSVGGTIFKGGLEALGAQFEEVKGGSIGKGFFKRGYGGHLGKYKGVSRFMGGISLLFAGLGAYEGYQQGGVRGAVKGAAGSLAENFVFGAALKGLGVSTAGMGTPTGLAASIPFVAHAAWTGRGMFESGGSFGAMMRPYVADHMRRHSELEMGRPVIDQFGNLATMRQRSISAIQGSKINGRTGLGMEATLLYSPYFR